MNRTDFLTSPQAWTRVRRIDQSQADYASAIERTSTDYSPNWWGAMALIAVVTTILVVVLA